MSAPDLEKVFAAGVKPRGRTAPARPGAAGSRVAVLRRDFAGGRLGGPFALENVGDLQAMQTDQVSHTLKRVGLLCGADHSNLRFDFFSLGN
jgi:hypothetical protein